MREPLLASPALPLRAGVGLRAPHYAAFASGRPDTGFLEIHPENYFGGGARTAYLEEAARYYPLSFHCVGLSLGSPQRPASTHLSALKKLVARFNPVAVSDHLSWSASGNAHLNDLLPLPYTAETMHFFRANVNAVQDALGRAIFVENPTAYLTFPGSRHEAEFLSELATLTGCRILLDVNNLYVNHCNNSINMADYLARLDSAAVAEIHLAGHALPNEHAHGLRIDTHDHPVSNPVWALYAHTLALIGPKPTLIEWDANIPPLDTLLGEAEKAESMMRVFMPAEARHDAAA